LLEEYAYQPLTAALVESFDTTRDVPARDVPGDAVGVGPVDWPAECPGMKSALGTFYRAADDVARDLFTALAAAACLDHDDAAAASELSERFLADFGVTSHCSMRTMRYPGRGDAEARELAGGLEGMGFPEASGRKRARGEARRSLGEEEPSRSGDQGSSSARDAGTARARKKRRRASDRTDTGPGVRAVGIAEHTDFECFTLLHQSAPGLELRDAAGTWREAGVFPCEGGDSAKFTVIIADVVERWTNGFFPATPHRVALSDRERFSIVRFNGLDPGAVVEPLLRWFPTNERRTEKATASKKYRATTQGEHVAASVTAAAKNLEDAIEAGAYPTRALSPDPGRFAQLLAVRTVPGPNPARRQVLLGRHAEGEFEGKWTGFIAACRWGETPREAAIRAAGEAGDFLTFSSEGAKETLVAERARVMFEGWADEVAGEEARGGVPSKRPVVEHEFTVEVDRTRGDARADVDDAKLPAESASSSEGAGGRRTMRPVRWFDVDDAPYDDMPEDDRFWYPTVLAMAFEDSDASGANERAGWRRVALGRFKFDESGGLERHELETVWTDA